MPIVTKLKGLKTPGEYPLMVMEISKDPSKAGNPMLTVQFKVIDGDEGIRSWYVAKNKGAMKELAELKLACGLPPQAVGEDLLGCKVIGVVALDPPTADGKVFSRIKSVRPMVSGFKSQPDPNFKEEEHDEQLPF